MESLIKAGRIYFMLALACLISSSAYCWNARGHMITAAIAWEQLTDEEKEKVTNLLMQHPDYERKWKQAYQSHVDDMELGQFLMMEASTWLDDIRNRNDPNYELHRGEWHYINYRIEFPNGHSSEDPNGEKPDVVWAIDHVIESIEDVHTPEDQRAMYFAWLLYLVGDIHQPLHCIALFDDDAYRNGDRGGNRFYVIANTAPISLHSLWDALSGSSNNIRTARNQALILINESPTNGFPNLNNSKKPVEWSIEGFELGKKSVYLDGTLKGSYKKNEAQKLPDDYTKEAKAVGEKQLTLAEYRMGNAIKILI